MKLMFRTYVCTAPVLHFCIALLLMGALVVPEGTHAAPRYQGVLSLSRNLTFPQRLIAILC